jgi:hypothetical protein
MYGSTAGVEARVPALGAFGATSAPTATQVESWLTEASALIDGALASAGYATGVGTGAAIYPLLSGLANLYAAATALEARGIDTVSGAETTRSDEMFARFWAQLKALGAGDLKALGATTATVTRRRLRTTQLRRIDGYSGAYEGAATQYSYPSE